MLNGTTDQLKALYNTELTEARRHTYAARSLREAIVAREPSYAGPSMTRLAEATAALDNARSFANAPNEPLSARTIR